MRWVARGEIFVSRVRTASRGPETRSFQAKATWQKVESLWGERVRESQERRRERETDREKQTERERERERERKRERERAPEITRGASGSIEQYLLREMFERQRHRHTDTQTHRETDTQRDRHTEREAIYIDRE